MTSKIISTTSKLIINIYYGKFNNKFREDSLVWNKPITELSYEFYFSRNLTTVISLNSITDEVIVKRDR
jgi:hypothetical protein